MKITDEYVEAKPYIKCALAVILYLRHPLWTVDESMQQAGKFLKAMEQES